MTGRGLRGLGALVVSVVALETSARPPLGFDELVRMSDRIVVATVRGAAGEIVRLPNGSDIALGVKDPESGKVFTPYRIVVSECVFDAADSCTTGESELSIPGGTVYESVDGERRLRTWEVAGAASVPLPLHGEELLLLLARRQGRYVMLNDAGARTRVDRTSDAPSVRLSFSSPRFLTPAGLESARSQLGSASASNAKPLFTERVPLDDLKRLVTLARQVPKPTSGNLHAIPSCADGDDVHAVCRHGDGVRTGQDPVRRESALGLVADHDLPDGTGHDRRSRRS